MAVVLKKYAEKSYGAWLYRCNCYVVKDEESGEAFVVDSGVYDVDFEKTLRDFGVESLTYILLTHGHFDHICGVKKLKETFGGKIVIHQEDENCLLSGEASLASYFGALQDNANADITVKDGSILPFGKGSIEVIHTPGHTKGSVCYKIGDMLFSGDTLFRLSMGRTDLPGGNGADIELSLKHLASIKENLTVLPGHSEKTSLDYERKYNPFMRGF